MYRGEKNRNYLLVFEVKSSDKCYRKAMWQLNTHEKTFGNTVDKFYKFYVHPKNPNRKHGYKIERITKLS